MSIINQNLLNADASVNQTSSVVSIGYYRGYSVHGIITGSATGTITLMASADPGVGTPNYVSPASNWVIVDSSILPISASVPYMANVSNAFYSWMKAVYTVTSGSGQIVINYNSKDDV